MPGRAQHPTDEMRHHATDMALLAQRERLKDEIHDRQMALRETERVIRQRKITEPK